MAEYPTIEQLRSLIDLNFCEKDKILYRRIIEPGIKAIIKDYWQDWNEIEWQITTMIMMIEGVYKKQGGIIISFNSPEEAEQYKDEMDVELFKKIVRKNFKWKINYLQNKNILSHYAYKLLDILRKKRNKIHRPFTYLSEQDLIEFSYGSRIVQGLWHTMFPKLDEGTIKKVREEIEKQAKLYCSLIKN